MYYLEDQESNAEDRVDVTSFSGTSLRRGPPKEFELVGPLLFDAGNTGNQELALPRFEHCAEEVQDVLFDYLSSIRKTPGTFQKQAKLEGRNQLLDTFPPE